MYKWYQYIKSQYFTIFAEEEIKDNDFLSGNTSENGALADDDFRKRIDDIELKLYDYRFIQEIYNVLNQIIPLNREISSEEIERIRNDIGTIIKGNEGNPVAGAQDILIPHYNKKIKTRIDSILKNYIPTLYGKSEEEIKKLNARMAIKIYNTILRITRETYPIITYPQGYFSTSYSDETREDFLANKYLPRETSISNEEQEEIVTEILPENKFEPFEIKNENLSYVYDKFIEDKISKETYNDIKIKMTNNSLLEDIENTYQQISILNIKLSQGTEKKQDKINKIFDRDRQAWKKKEEIYWERFSNRNKQLLPRITQFFNRKYNQDCFWWVIAAHCFPKNKIQKKDNQPGDAEFTNWMINFIMTSCNNSLELHHSLIERSVIRDYLILKELENLEKKQENYDDLEYSNLSTLLNEIWENLRKNYSLISIRLCQNHHQPTSESISSNNGIIGSIHGDQAKGGSMYNLKIPTGYSFEEIIYGAYLWWTHILNNNDLKEAHKELFDTVSQICERNNNINDSKAYLDRIMAAYYHSYRMYWQIEKTVVIQRFIDLMDMIDSLKETFKSNKTGFLIESNLKNEINSFFELIRNEYGQSDLLQEIVNMFTNIDKEKINELTKPETKKYIITRFKNSNIIRNPMLVDIIKIMSTYFSNKKNQSDEIIIENKDVPYIAISLHRYYKNVINILKLTEPLENFMENPEWIDKGESKDEKLKELYTTIKEKDNIINESVLTDFEKGRRGKK